MQENLKFQCKVDSKSPIVRELTVTVEPESFQGYMQSSLGRLQKTAEIKGFRKGKVPLDMIRKFYLKDVKADVVKQVVSDSFWRAVREQNINPVGAPEISNLQNHDLEDGKTLTFTAKVEVFPEIKLSNLGKLKVTRYNATIGEADVDKALENMRQNQAEVLSSEGDASYQRAAKEGDMVEMSFQGACEGVPSERLSGERQTVKVGDRRFMEEIEQGLIGMKPGAEKTVTVKFPEDFPDAQIAGKDVAFQLTLHEIKKVQLPALDDEFAKRFQVDTLEQLKDRVRKSLSEEKQNEATSRTRESLMRALLDNHTFDVPRALVDAEMNAMVEDLSSRMKRQGLPEKMIQGEVARQEEQMRKVAEDRVRVFLMQDHVAENQKLQVTDELLTHEFDELAKNVGAPSEQIRQFYERSEDAMRRLKYRLKEGKVVEYLLSQVKVEDATV